MRAAFIALVAFAASALPACKQRASEGSEVRSVLLDHNTQRRFWSALQTGTVDVCIRNEGDPSLTAKLRRDLTMSFDLWLSAVNTHTTRPIVSALRFDSCSSDALLVVIGQTLVLRSGELYTVSGAVVFRNEYTAAFTPRSVGDETYALHEMGHLFGLAHTHNQTDVPEFMSIMSYTWCGSRKCDIEKDEAGNYRLWPDDVNGAVQALRNFAPARFDDKGKYEGLTGWRLFVRHDRNYFGPGLLIASVVPGKAADLAGILPNEVLLQVNETKIDSFRAYFNAMEAARGRARITSRSIYGVLRQRDVTTQPPGTGLKDGTTEDEAIDVPRPPRPEDKSIDFGEANFWR